MKRCIFLMAVLLSSPCIWAVPDIEFSPGGTPSGYWHYQGITNASGTFSFHQQIDIDFIQGTQADALYKQFVFMPNLSLSGYTSSGYGMGIGFVSAGGSVEIKDGSNNLLLSGTLQSGNLYAIFATSSVYPEIAADIKVTYLNNSINSAYLGGLSVGDLLDLNLTIQASVVLDQVIKAAGTAQNGFSGSMTTTIPEPATIGLLAMGGVLLRRKK